MQIILANLAFSQAGSMKGVFMMKRVKWFAKQALCMGAAAFLALCFTASVEGAVETAPKKKKAKGDDLFNSTNVVRISIEISRSDYAALGATHWGGRGGGRDRPEVKAIIREGNKVYRDVALHLKGAAGSFQPINHQPSLTLNFDKHVPKQDFHGLDKLSLNSSVQDRTFITEKLCRELFDAAGIPVPRADYAMVTLNGRNLGLYVLTEGFNKQFLRRYFEDVSGNLYDGGFCQDITGNLSVNSGDLPNDHSDLERLAEAAHAVLQNDQLDELSKILDIDRFLTMIAMEVILCHWDGYAMNKNNYRVYHDQDIDRIIFIPHGMDQMFGMSGQAGPDTPLVPHMNGLVAKAVISSTQGRERYLRIIGELATNVFQVEAITTRIRELEARIQPYIAEGRRMSVAQHRSVVNRLCQNIEERGRNLADQLNAPNRALVFDSNGEALLEGWRERTTVGQATFDKPTASDGRKLLHIAANRGLTAASWRATVSLKRGWYVLEGMAKTKGVGQDGQSGADLRISGSTTRKYLRGNTDWTHLTFPFRVQEVVRDLVLVCELKGNRGEVWFDPATLKLKHLDETRVER